MKRSKPAMPPGKPKPEILKAPSHQNWVARSDQYAHQYLAVLRRFEPELLSWFGDSESDANIPELPEDSCQQEVAAYVELTADLSGRLAEENDSNVRADLEVLVDRCGQRIDLLRAEEEHLLPYVNLPQTIFLGLRSLLDERNEPERRTAALLRLRRYAGSEPSEKPILERLQARLHSRFQDRHLLAPPRKALERDLQSSLTIAENIGGLFESCEVAGFQKDLGRLREQLRDHDTFCRQYLLPIARQDFRLPTEVYQARLRSHGVDISVDELASRAKVEFQKTQREMGDLARNLTSTKFPMSSEYRPIVRELMKKRVPSGKLLPHYGRRLRKLWRLLERHDILSFPETSVQLVAATPAESTVCPYLHVRPPRYLSRLREPIEVVLPSEVSPTTGRVAYGLDVKAVSWSAVVHEAAHAVQASAIQRSGQSLVRSIFGSSSDLEGWAVYLESEVRPYLTPESRFASLHGHLRYAAKAFLEPGLHTGRLTVEDAARVLRDDVVVCRETVCAEIERYTTLWPGQAPSYLYGYLQEIELRADAELALGSDFHVREYHDFLLSVGLLSRSRRGGRMLEEYVPRFSSPPRLPTPF